MTHDELLARIDLAIPEDNSNVYAEDVVAALRAVLELHKPDEDNNCECQYGDLESQGAAKNCYPCGTIQAIEKELS